MKTIFSTLDKRSAKYIWRITLTMVLVFSGFYAAFNRVAFLEHLYVFPIILASWYGSNKSGVALAFASTILLYSINVYHTGFNTETLLIYALPCILIYTVLAIMITNFRNVHRQESLAADTDALTNINNARAFYMELANELVRSSRYHHIFSLAYLDIDNFKFINDSFGHAEGDDLLIEVANCLNDSLRASDVVARIGGDEFACLLPETEQEEARKAFTKTSDLLNQRMTKRNWPVSFSVGLVTFDTMPDDIKEAMKVADELMYSVKNLEKNSVSYKIWHGKM